MSTIPFIPKEDINLPNSYSITIFYLNGKKDEIEVASHSLRETVRVYCAKGDFKDESGSEYNIAPATSTFLEYCTNDDQWGWVPMSSIQRLEFDKRFSKVMESKKKLVKKDKMN